MQEYTAHSDIFTIDALYLEPEIVSIHLIRTNNRIAIIDTGNIHSVAQIQAGLKQLDLDFDAVDFIILTHIHLDHAGGASKLISLCKNAQLVVHPKGARHMIDPQKLIAGTTAVYGKQAFEELYGEILPIPAERIIEPKDGEIIDFSGRPLLFIDTPGHANHHHCIVDSQSESVFTGDTLGVSYRTLREGDDAFMTPTTTPVQFDPAALHKSIDKVMSLKPKTLYLTHYSAVAPTTKNIAGLHEQIDDFIILTEQCSQEENFAETLTERLLNYLTVRCMNEIPSITGETVRKVLALDAKLNAQGLVFWWQNRREA